MAKKSAAPAADIGEDHQLVARFRHAMEKKDLVTMGQMLELLGTMRAELLMGKPVIEKLATTRKETGAASSAAQAAAKVSKANPSGTPAARLAR